MKLRQLLNVVPRSVRVWALVTICCAVLIGLVAGCKTADGDVLRTMALDGLAALALGAVLAVWMLAIGFVFGDARRRAMRAGLWALVVLLFPHLLGFLLYFVMRPPIAAPCAHCGQPISATQRFCSSCGAPQLRSAPTDPPFAPGLDQQPTS